MSLLWSAQQREWLQALGHPVLVLAGDQAALPSEPVSVDRVSVEASSSTPEPPSRPPRALELEPLATASTRGASVPVAAEHRRLHRALLRATGQRTTRAAEQALATLQFDLSALRNDPAAKRALWPRLRALHGARRP